MPLLSDCRVISRNLQYQCLMKYISSDTPVPASSCDGETILEIANTSGALLKADVTLVTSQDDCSNNSPLKMDALEEEEFSLDDVKLKLQSFLTKNQVDSLLSGQKIMQYDDEAIALALSLKSLSIKMYNYLKNQLSLPLPHVATLNRHLSKIDMEPGFLCSVFRVMTVISQTMDPAHRVCIILFDEMKISSKYCYDKGSDTLYKPHKYVQVCMVRGIMGSWKQIVYYNFDTNITKELLFQIITAVEECNFEVHAIVSDLGGSNQGLWKSLGICRGSCSFRNPVNDNRLVFVFADAPHLLKLIRNNILDHVLVTDQGNIDSSALWELVNNQAGDFTICPKLSTSSLIVKGVERQRVRTAAHVLSETVGKALEFLGENGKLSARNWKIASEFILLVDRWFDLMNSKSTKPDKKTRRAFNGHASQVEVLEESITMFRSMKIKGRFFPFQLGIETSCYSLLGLFEQLQSLHSFKYILTCRLNQDLLENTFGILRQMNGTYDHPDPVTLKYRIRNFVLSDKHVLVSSKPNTIAQDNTLQLNMIAELRKASFRDGSISCSSDVYTFGELDSFSVPDNEVEGFKYALGFVAHKFRKQYPHLISATTSNDQWIAKISRGNLTSMHQDFHKEFIKLDYIFRTIHGDALNESPNAVCIISELSSKLSINLPSNVVIFFVRCRIYFKIRKLNKNLSLLKKITVASKSTKIKKMKKIIT